MRVDKPGQHNPALRVDRLVRRRQSGRIARHLSQIADSVIFKKDPSRIQRAHLRIHGQDPGVLYQPFHFVSSVSSPFGACHGAVGAASLAMRFMYSLRIFE